MNLIDNGIAKVINIERVIKEQEVYFLVTFADWYNQERQKKFMSIENIEEQRWME